MPRVFFDSIMKKIIVWVSSATLLAGVLFATIFVGGCSKDNVERPASEGIIGTWTMQMLGETGEDILSVTMLFKKDSTVTITTESDFDDVPSRTDMYWAIDGDRITFAYVDEDEDGDPDPEDKLEWEEYTLKMGDGTLSFTDEWGMSFGEYTRL